MRKTVLQWGSQPSTWIYLLLAYPVIDYVLRNILPIPVISSLWDEGLLLVLLLFTLLAYIKKTRSMPPVRHLLAAFFVLGAGLTVSDMANWEASVEGFRAVYQYVLAFFIGFYLFSTTEQLERFLKVLTLIGFLAALVGIMQVALGVKTPGSWVQEGEAITTRAYSFVTSPNVLGSYMALIAPIAAGLALKVPGRKEKLIWAGVTAATLLALLLTASRGAWFALAFALFICCCFWSRRIAAGLAAAGAAGVAGLFFVPDSVPLIGSVKNRIFGLFTSDYIASSMQAGRLERWGTAYDKMRIEPLFGAGLGHHGGAVGSRHFGTIYTDSYFFKSLAEFGLIGTILLVALAVVMMVYSVRVIRRQKNTSAFFLLLGLFGGLLAVAMHNFVENIFEVPFMALYFWLFCGFFSAMYDEQILTKKG